jgi:hypothetical protein
MTHAALALLLKLCAVAGGVLMIGLCLVIVLFLGACLFFFLIGLARRAS